MRHNNNNNRIVVIDKLLVVSYQIVHWAGVPVRTNEHSVTVGKTTDQTAEQSCQLTGWNGNELAKLRINLTNVDHLHVLQQITELCVRQPWCQLKSINQSSNQSSNRHDICLHANTCFHLLGNSKDIQPARIPLQQSPKVLWKNYGGPGLTWSNLWKNWPVKQKLKAVLQDLSTYSSFLLNIKFSSGCRANLLKIIKTSTVAPPGELN